MRKGWLAANPARLGSATGYVEPQPDGTVRILPWREPSPSEAAVEAELRERQGKRSRTVPIVGGGRERAPSEQHRAWDKTVLEHEVEKRARAEGKGGQDE
jgi:hypothetical protein